MGTELSWATAASLDDFAKLSGLWLTGKLQADPFPEDDGHYEETQEIVDDLVELNRNGLFTTCSQPALPIENGSGQRAFVTAFATEALGARIRTLELVSELLVIAYSPNQLNLELVEQHQFRECIVPVTTEDYRPFTRVGMAFDLDPYLGVVSPEGARALQDAWQITVVDLKWGRKRLLWDKLRRVTNSHYSTKWSPDSYEDLAYLEGETE